MPLVLEKVQLIRFTLIVTVCFHVSLPKSHPRETHRARGVDAVLSVSRWPRAGAQSASGSGPQLGAKGTLSRSLRETKASGVSCHNQTRGHSRGSGTAERGRPSKGPAPRQLPQVVSTRPWGDSRPSFRALCFMRSRMSRFQGDAP